MNVFHSFDALRILIVTRLQANSTLFKQLLFKLNISVIIYNIIVKLISSIVSLASSTVRHCEH